MSNHNINGPILEIYELLAWATVCIVPLDKTTKTFNAPWSAQNKLMDGWAKDEHEWGKQSIGGLQCMVWHNNNGVEEIYRSKRK